MCQMIQRCVPHEQVYIKTVLTGTVQESIDSLSNQEAFVNDMELLVEEYSLIDNIDKLICSLALIHSDNRPLADKLYRLLDNRQILLTAENSDDKELLNKLRLLYVLAVYHPVFTFSQRHHLLSVYLRHLDELYHHVAEYEEHNKVSCFIILLVNNFGMLKILVLCKSERLFCVRGCVYCESHICTFIETCRITFVCIICREKT